MQVFEILQFERMRKTSAEARTIHLFSYGNFWRAYEWSAWLLFCSGVEMMINAQHIEDGKDYLYVGFPKHDKSWAKYVPADVEKSEKLSDDHFAITLHAAKSPDNAMPDKMLETFNGWREPIMGKLQEEGVLKKKKKNDSQAAPQAPQAVADFQSQLSQIRQSIESLSRSIATAEEKPVTAMDILRRISNFNVVEHTPNETVDLVVNVQKDICAIFGF